MTKYYYAGTQRVAMRTGSTLYWMLGDHLGSTTITADSSGNRYGELRYKAWGENRYSYGTTLTSFRYTGQRSEETGFGLYYYGARWYDSALSRFVQADTIVPEQMQGVQAWDRYAYVNNNPLKYTDPSGHAACSDYGDCPEPDDVYELDEKPGTLEQVLAWQLTPLLTSAAQVVTGVFMEASLMFLPAPLSVEVFIGFYLANRLSSAIGLASVDYQYNRNLYGTTKFDVVVETGTTLLGTIPSLTNIMASVSLIYTFGRTLGVPSP